MSPSTEEHTARQAHLLYLIRSGHIARGIELYQEKVKETKKHDFPLLEEIGYTILLRGAEKGDKESRFLTMYGIQVADMMGRIDLFEKVIEGADPDLFQTAIRILADREDDQAEKLIEKGFSSPYTAIRLEAAHALAKRKSTHAVSRIRSLMHHLPPDTHFLFPELFALSGDAEAIPELRHLMESPFSQVRSASVLAIIKFGLFEFIPAIRSGLTHAHEEELEACAVAAGLFYDQHSIPLLEGHGKAKSPCVRLATYHSLIRLGFPEYRNKIIDLVNRKNLFAIHCLGDSEEERDLLATLCSDEKYDVRINAAIALLHKRDTRAVPTLMGMLISNRFSGERDFGFEEIFSPGRAFRAWHTVPSLSATIKHTKNPSILLSTIELRETILQGALEYPEELFVEMAETILDKREHAIVPLLIKLLGNMRTEKSIALLRRGASAFGAPFIRTYCHLALYDILQSENHRRTLTEWLRREQGTSLIRLRPLPEENNRRYPDKLTLEETSRLLIEGFTSLASNHSYEGIDTLLEAIKGGHRQNRYALAGLLLHSIQ
ncbi:MAG: hypothetical protein OXF02_06975 [Simkaniaceae bacterium]|nr:hypothetical protein [Simkaniaceae bacterium]